MVHRLVTTLAWAVVLVTAIPVAGETLADILRKEVPTAPLPPVDVHSPITSYEVLNDASNFLIGYYAIVAEDPGGLHPPLRVLLLDKRKSSWQHREIQDKTAALEEPENSCAGSVNHINSAGTRFLLETHLTPSAGCTFVLSRSLQVQHILFGWPVAFFSSGRVIVEGNTTHFAGTHPLRLTLYDSSTDAEITLLPRRDDMILKRITDALTELADDSWCRENNASCKPEDLSGHLKSSQTIIPTP